MQLDLTSNASIETRIQVLENMDWEDDPEIVSLEKVLAGTVDTYAEVMERLNRITETRHRYEKKAGELSEEIERLKRSATYLRSEAEMCEAEASKIKRVRSESQTKLNNLRSTAECKEDFITGMRMLLSAKDFIDTNHSVIYSNFDFEWTTKPIFINDINGAPLPCPFGRFRVHLWIENGCLMSSYMAQEPRKVNGYPHPHINSSGSPCHGDAGVMLLKAVQANNIAMAVAINHEYLTRYNHESPFVPLDAWVPNSWETATCTCGLVLKTYCGCNTCFACGAVNRSGEQWLTTSVCPNCLASLYTECGMSKLHKTGIGGSGYILLSEVAPRCGYGYSRAYCKSSRAHSFSCECTSVITETVKEE